MGFGAIGSSNKDAGIDQQHEMRSDAVSKLLGCSVGSFAMDIEGFRLPGRDTTDERFQRIIKPGSQLVDEGLSGDPAALSFDAQPESCFPTRSQYWQ